MNTAQLVDGSLAAGDGETRAAADIELSAVAGLERPPPVENSVSIETAVLIASSPESKTSKPSGKSNPYLNILQNNIKKKDEARAATNDAKFLKDEVDTLMKRLEEKFKDDAAMDVQHRAGGLHSELIAKLTTLDRAENIMEMDFNCYNYCAPLLQGEGEKREIWQPKSYSAPTHPHFDSPITPSARKGIYFGESKTVSEGGLDRSGKKVPSGFGIWVSVDRHNPVEAPVCVFIMGGCWSWDDKSLDGSSAFLDGSMLHFFANKTSTSAEFQRCVGFSYKGSFKNKKPAAAATPQPAAAATPQPAAAATPQAAAAATPPVVATPMFDCQDEDAVFREFETACPRLSGGAKMALWLDMFIDSLSDDGRERQKCREFRQHMIATKFVPPEKDNKNGSGGYMYHILEHYLGGGMQYFVPAMVYESDVVSSIMRVKDGGEEEETQPVDVIVLDLVLYKGRWSEGKKKGTCRFFLCYRNYCLPKFSTSDTNKTNFFSHIRTSGSSGLSANGILRSSQFLSGCFFSGEFGDDLLSYGSLFYYHKRFCLTCEKQPQQSSDAKCQQWLLGSVKYFDCITGSSFTAEWEATKVEDENLYEGIWNMGSVHADAKEDNFGDGKFCVRKSIKIKDSKCIDFAHGDWIDIKDGLPGRMMRLFKADLSYYLCDSGNPTNQKGQEEADTVCCFTIDKKSCFKHFGGTSAPSHLPARGWSSAKEIWEDMNHDFTTEPIEIAVAVDPVFNYDTPNERVEPVKVKLVGAGSEVPNGRARLFNSLGIPIWEGELKDGEPSLDGATITHMAVDIHEDVVESPDFGLTVLALCAPSVAYFVDGKDGEPHMILALLPFPLLLAQWGMLLTVFYQSIEDWRQTSKPVLFRELCQLSLILDGLCFVTAFLQFCFKESLDDDPDLNITLYLCRAVMSFLCILYLKRASQTVAELFSLLSKTKETKENLRRRGLFRYSSSIGTACLIDSVTELLAESLCLIINLWMVFGANKPIDMVLNSLALEFIKSIDNEFCEFFLNEYPGIVSNIERRLRQKDESTINSFLNPTSDGFYYGYLSVFPGLLGLFFYEGVASPSFGVFKNLSPDNRGFYWPAFILFWLVSGPLCLVLWLVAIALFLGGVAFFLAVYPIPVFMWMFGFKYLLHWARVFAIIVSACTPVFILAFLFYSPICKAVAKE